MVPLYFISFPLMPHLFIPSRVHLLSPKQRGRRGVICLKTQGFIGSTSAFYSPSKYINCIRLITRDHMTQLLLKVYISFTNKYNMPFLAHSFHSTQITKYLILDYLIHSRSYITLYSITYIILMLYDISEGISCTRSLVPSSKGCEDLLLVYLCTRSLVHSFTRALVHLYFILDIYSLSGNRISHVLLHSSLILINSLIYHNCKSHITLCFL